LERMGFKKENRDFWPHLTLGRVRSPKNIAVLANELYTYKLPETIKISIERITFFKSTLTPAGPIYEKLM